MKNDNKIIKNRLWNKVCEVDQSGRFYHYTTKEAIKSIVDSLALRFSLAKELNDSNDKSNNYILSFTTSSVENIPMWYLYTGVNANGVRINITKTGINKILNQNLYYIEGNEKKFIERTNYKISFHPIVYYEDFKTKDKGYAGYNRIKFNHNVFYTTENEISKMRKNPTFLKKMEWSYEKETRMCIEVLDNSLREKIGDFLYVDLKGIISHFSITLGPNFSDKDNKDIEDKLRKTFNGKSLEHSTLTDVINFDICKRCNKNNK